METAKDLTALLLTVTMETPVLETDETIAVQKRQDGFAQVEQQQLQMYAPRYEEMEKGTTLCLLTVMMETQSQEMDEAMAVRRKQDTRVQVEVPQHPTHALRYEEMASVSTQ